MIEFMMHFLGICGESHPNVLVFLFGEMGIDFNMMLMNIKAVYFKFKKDD